MATTDRYGSLNVAPAASDDSMGPRLSSPGVTTVGRGVRVKGQLTATEHVIIEGGFEGEVMVPDFGVAVSGTADVHGDVCAKTVTVLGRVSGSLTASTLVELRATSLVTGRLVSPRVIIEEGAQFNGTVDPSKAEAAVAVVRHRLQQPAEASRRESQGSSQDKAPPARQGAPRANTRSR